MKDGEWSRVWGRFGVVWKVAAYIGGSCHEVMDDRGISSI